MSIGRNGLGGLEGRRGCIKMGYKNLFKDDKINIYVIVAFLSAVVFCLIYGVKVLNPTYIDWLLAGEDLTQHYLGWTAYRASCWHFPIGMVDTLAYPYQTSIIFTDSIPLFAVFFKLLSPMLPETFQYFGFWGITSFILQGILTARIIRNYTKSKVAIVVSSILFTFTPVMIMRLYGHDALAGQWILLLGLELIFAHKKYQSGRKIFFIVGMMGMLAVSIHMYFVLMCGITLIGVCFVDILEYRSLKRSGLLLIEYLVMVAAVTWLLGGFNSGTQNSGYGLGLYSSNLNTLFNSQGWSRIYKQMPLYVSEQGEGCGYLGGGCIVLLLLVIVCLADKSIKVYVKGHWKESVALILVSVISMAVALSPVITMGDRVLVQMQLPQWLIDKWSVFRASGRVVWIDVYIIMLISCIVVIKILNKRMMIAAFLVALAVQIYDISDLLIEKHETFSFAQKYVSLLAETGFWDYIAQNSDVQHVVYYSTVEQPMMYSITDWAMRNGKTVNNFYFPRSLADKISVGRMEALNTLSKDTLFVFNEDECMDALRYDLHYYRVDGLIVGYRDKIPGYKEMMDSEFILKWEFGDNLYLSENGGMDIENGREIYPGGLSYGPYWSVARGDYVVTISGDDMKDGMDVLIYSQHGELYHDFKVISQTPQEIKIMISFAEDIEDLEICIKNNLEIAAVIRSVEIRNVG